MMNNSCDFCNKKLNNLKDYYYKSLTHKNTIMKVRLCEECSKDKQVLGEYKGCTTKGGSDESQRVPRKSNRH